MGRVVDFFFGNAKSAFGTIIVLLIIFAVAEGSIFSAVWNNIINLLNAFIATLPNLIVLCIIVAILVWMVRRPFRSK